MTWRRYTTRRPNARLHKGLHIPLALHRSRYLLEHGTAEERCLKLPLSTAPALTAWKRMRPRRWPSALSIYTITARLSRLQRHFGGGCRKVEAPNDLA